MKSVANRAVTWLVAVGILAIGCVRLAAGSIALGTALLLFGVIVGSSAVRQPDGPIMQPTLGSALLVVFASWVGLGLLTYQFADWSVPYLHTGPSHNLPKGLLGLTCVALGSVSFGAFSIGLRRGLLKWLS